MIGVVARRQVTEVFQEIPPSVFRNAATVLRTAAVTPLSSCRSSLRFQRRVDLNACVFDSPRLMSSSALRWARRYWSKRKFLTASAKARSSVMRL